jgi:hypothetical protein
MTFFSLYNSTLKDPQYFESDLVSIKKTICVAVSKLPLDCLKVVNRGCVYEYATEYAASEGKFEYLKYCVEEGFPKHKNATYYSARNGHLECLRYCVEQGFPKHQDAVYGAACNGHVECSKYCAEQGFPKHQNAAMSHLVNIQSKS